MDFPKINSKYEHVNTFINTLAPIVCNEYLRRKSINNKIIFPSVVLAQAGTESGWNLNAKTLFGIKGSDVQLNTSEFINGKYVNVTDGFKSFPSISAAVQGYYNLMQWDNYDDATSQTTVEGQIDGLTNDVGLKYATSPTYYNTILNVVNSYGLRVFDDFVNTYNSNPTPQLEPQPAPDINALADAVIRGEYGNGAERKIKLGTLYDAVQAKVDEKLNANKSQPAPHPSVTVGSNVRFTGTTDYNGNTLKYHDRIFNVKQINGDRVVLTYNGAVYAAVRLSEVTLA